jgi:hypothetical protein
MLPSQIENWALQIIERIEKKQPIEDSRVELKSEWIEPQKGARRLAGHANAARGEPILWLIGVHEDNGVIGVEKEELPVWINKVKSCFDGIAPSPQDIAVPYNGKTVIALLFETDRAPFVIKVPEHGKAKGVPSHEVPWREGTEVRTAQRTDLIKILVPKLKDPEIEILNGSLKLFEHQQDITWIFHLEVYITPSIGSSFVIPFHRCSISFAIEKVRLLVVMNKLSIKPPYKYASTRGAFVASPLNLPREPDSSTIIHTNEDVLIIGPGRMNIEAHYQESLKEKPSADALKESSLTVFLQMTPTYIEKTINEEVMLQWRLRNQNDDSNMLGAWILADR